MNTFHKIEAAVEAAAEIPEKDFSAWLDKYCDGDDGLRAEIESLLDCRKDSSRFLELSAAGYAASLLADDDGKYIDKQFGVYKIVRELGRGGMGAVYLARRSDGEFDRQVALKIIGRTFVDPELERHFRRERQILAQLDHPNIAKLLDGGVSENGELYLVMEFVDGIDLIQYCRSKNLGTRDRLRLVLKVFEAVLYAHRNLIIHRDIKLSNILVTDTGEPKLLDFGLAKALDDSIYDAESTQTAFRALTPAYASPEQVRGDTVTAASDIYSLGKVLEKLLHASVDGSDDVTLGKDLTNILDVAMREEAERRYSSVDAFIDDVHRYLNSRPVKARPSTIGYRAGKFIRRNKLAVAAAGVASIAILGGFATAIWEAGVARDQRDLAQQQRLKAERTSEFLAAALQYSDPSAAIPGTKNRRDATIREMLDDFAPRVESEFADQPEILVSLEQTVGLAYMAQARLPEAERYLNAALKVSLNLNGENSHATAALYAGLASVMEAKGDLPLADTFLQKSLTVYREHPPDDDIQRRNFAMALSSAGDIYWTTGDYVSADAAYSESLAAALQIPNNYEIVANAKRGLGITRYAQGRLEEAASLLRETVNEYRNRPHLRWKLPDVLNFLGQTLAWKNQNGDQKELKEALAYLKESETISLEVWGEENFWYPRSLWLQVYAMCFQGKTECAAAEPGLSKSEQINDRLYPNNKVTKANIYDARSMILASSGRTREAEEIARKAVALYQTSMNRGAPSITIARIHLADSLAAQKKYSEAENVLADAYKDASEMQGVDHWRTKEVERRLAELHKISKPSG